MNYIKQRESFCCSLEFALLLQMGYGKSAGTHPPMVIGVDPKVVVSVTLNVAFKVIVFCNRIPIQFNSSINLSETPVGQDELITTGPLYLSIPLGLLFAEAVFLLLPKSAINLLTNQIVVAGGLVKSTSSGSNLLDEIALIDRVLFSSCNRFILVATARLCTININVILF